MSSYAIGVLFGRLLASYVIVLVGFTFLNKFKFNLAFRKSYKWYGLLLTVILFSLGLAVSVGRSGAL